MHQDQLSDGSRKITHIADIREFKDNEVLLRDIFCFEIKEEMPETKKVIGEWQKTREVPSFINKLKKFDKRFNEDFFCK